MIFRTFNTENIIFQIGSCNANRALKSANILGNDIKGIDLNMGCPKKFSIQGGMGAALLTNIETVEDIVKTWKRNLNINISCKIRLLKNDKKSIELCQNIAKCNVDALGIHARYIVDRPKDPARYKLIDPIINAINGEIPLIYNGDVFNKYDIKYCKENMKGIDSLMIARGAQWNPSLFDYNSNNESMKLMDLDKVMNRYIDISEKYNNIFANSKYVIVKMICGKKYLCKSDVSRKFQSIKTWNDCRDAIKFYKNFMNNYQNKIKSNIIKGYKSKNMIYSDVNINDRIQKTIEQYVDISAFHKNDNI